MSNTATILRRLQQHVFAEAVGEPDDDVETAHILLEQGTAYLYQGHGKGQKLLAMMPAGQLLGRLLSSVED